MPYKLRNYSKFRFFLFALKEEFMAIFFHYDGTVLNVAAVFFFCITLSSFVSYIDFLFLFHLSK